MPRRKNSPLIENDIRLAKSPEREAALSNQFLRKLEYISDNYEFWRNQERRTLTFNQSISAIKRKPSDSVEVDRFSTKLHPYADIMIAAKLSRLANRRPSQADVETAARDVAKSAKAVRGRPNDLILEHHVHGLMVLIEETSGEQARAQRDKNSDYNPQMSNDGGHMIELFFRHLDPAVTTTSLINIMREAKRSGAIDGKRFTDFFPFYCAKRDRATGQLKLTSGQTIERMEPVNPIYCP